MLIIALTLFVIFKKASVYTSHVWAHEFYIYLCAVIAVMAGGNVINDYYDQAIDLVNKPQKVIVGKVFSKTTTLAIYLALSMLGMMLSQRWLLFIYCVSAILSLWLYSYKLKKLPFIGNLLVALLTFFSIFLITNFSGSPWSHRVFEISLLAFFIQLIREIVKDIEDIDGDSKGNSKTFPIIYGLSKTKSLIYLIAGVFVLSTLYWQWNMQKHVWPLYALYYLTVVFVVKVFRAQHKSHYTFISGLLKMMMLVGLSSVLFI